MATQKFKRGDVVHIAKDLGQWMSHFEADQDVVVMGSYHDLYGGRSDSGPNGHCYSVLFFDGGEVSWYEEYQLTFLRHGGEQTIDEIQAAFEERKKVQADMAWIVANWKDIREHVPSPTADYLMARCGITQPWGSQGEGMAYYANWRQTFATLDPIITKFGTVEEVENFLKFMNEYSPLKPIDVRIGK